MYVCVAPPMVVGALSMAGVLRQLFEYYGRRSTLDPPISFHSQLIYDFKDGGGSFGLLTLRPERLPDKHKMKFEKIRVKIPSMMYVCIFMSMIVNLHVQYLIMQGFVFSRVSG